MKGNQGFEQEPKDKSRENELREMAKNGNVFAREELKCQETGLKANPQTYMKEKCPHCFVSPNGHKVNAGFVIATQRSDGFEYRGVICPLCGKTLALAVRKQKRE